MHTGDGWYYENKSQMPGTDHTEQMSRLQTVRSLWFWVRYPAWPFRFEFGPLDFW